MCDIIVATQDFEQNNLADYYVSLRVGELQKFSRISGSKNYKFPASAVTGSTGTRRYGKLEIFKRVGTGAISLDDGEMGLNVKCSGRDDIGFDITVKAHEPGSPQAAPTKKGPTKKDMDEKAQAAKAYLDKHHLEIRLSEAMTALLKERPDDPAAFVSERLRNSDVYTNRPKTCPASPMKAAGTATTMFGKYCESHIHSSGITPALYSKFPAMGQATKPMSDAEKVKICSDACNSLTQATSDGSLVAAVIKAKQASMSDSEEVKICVEACKALGDAWLLKTLVPAVIQERKARTFMKSPSVGTWCQIKPCNRSAQATQVRDIHQADLQTSPPIPDKSD